jgi:twitching motility protein PilT
MFDFDLLMSRMWDTRSSDMLLTDGEAPVIRTNGSLVRQGDEWLHSTDITELLQELLNGDSTWLQFKAGREVDFSFSWQDKARVRGNAFYQRGKPTVSLRMLGFAIPTFDELRVPQAVRDMAGIRQGLVFVTGPTGSGKSTTLASMIDWVNRTKAVHILTIEDPIEYLHVNHQAVISQREVGLDTESFPAALRNALREDPDVILVGEMRDLESIRFALTLAETGHLVLSTLHTNDTAQAIDRMVDVFPGDQQPQIRVQLSNALTGVVYQRLIPRRDGRGVVAAHEVLVGTSAIRNLIREGRTSQLRGQLQMTQREGGQTFESSLSALVREGLVDLATAQSFTPYAKEVAA